jgi:transcriptional regulator with AAA-type ATPase domain
MFSGARCQLGYKVSGAMLDDTTRSAAFSTEPALEQGPHCVRWLFPEGLGSHAVASGEGLVVGRGGDVDIVLPADEVSRRHCRLSRDTEGLLLEDLGSHNGTWLNGEAVQKATLVSGDILRLGQCVGQVTARGVAEPLEEILDGFFGGPGLQAALAPARRAAPTTLPVVIVGETGSGKELVARALHEWSGRKGALVTTNCAAIPETLAESHLFGHRAGAFTGATHASKGLFGAAQDGTLFLDEVAELSLQVQAKLLRVLEQKEVWALGAQGPSALNVRVVCATQAPLRNRVGAGSFRQDLFARLDGVTVSLPPLRSRSADIVPLFLYFASRAAGGHLAPIRAELIEAVCLHTWPMNVRELKQVAERLVALHGHEQCLLKKHLPEHLVEQEPPLSSASKPRVVLLKDGAVSDSSDELARLVGALKRYRGNVSRACHAAAISRQRAYRLLRAGAGVDLRSLRED